MKTIEKEKLNYLRLAFYDVNQDAMSEVIGLSKNTIRYALKWGKATEDTLNKLMDYAAELEKSKEII